LSTSDLVGRVLLRDDLRPQARTVVEELRDEGLRTVVLTGDRKATAEQLRTELRIDDVRAELNPDQKLSEIRSMTEQGQRVAMVGRIPLTVGVVGHEGSTVVVVMNSLRLLLGAPSAKTRGRPS